MNDELPDRELTLEEKAKVKLLSKNQIKEIEKPGSALDIVLKNRGLPLTLDIS